MDLNDKIKSLALSLGEKKEDSLTAHVGGDLMGDYTIRYKKHVFKNKDILLTFASEVFDDGSGSEYFYVETRKFPFRKERVYSCKVPLSKSISKGNSEVSVMKAGEWQIDINKALRSYSINKWG